MIFGRFIELERIDQVFARARSGHCAALLVLGEPGIGKTALLGTARVRAGAMIVLAARGVPSEADIPFAGLLDLVRPLLGRLSSIPDTQADALRGALGLGLPTGGDRFLVGAATLSLLAAAAEAEPVLLLVDDAHWLDGESLGALLFAVRRLDSDAVATLIAARTDELRLESVAGLDVLELRGLDLIGTAQLAEQRAGRRLNTHDAARVFEVTRGNPLAVIEIGTDEQALAFDGPAPLSRVVEDGYARRLDHLPPGVRSLLLIAAIDATLDAVKVEQAAASTGVATTLANAEGSGLVDLVEGRVVFRHPLVRSAVYQTASATERRAAHAAVARTLGRRELSGRRAWHEAAASVGPDERIAAALEAAADEARDRGGDGAAAVALERAAHLTPDSARRARRLYLAALSALRAGRAEQANGLVVTAVAACDEPLLRADIQFLHGLLLDRAGASTAAYRLLLREGRQVAEHDARRAAVMLARGCSVCINAGEIDAGLELGREAQQLADDSGASLEHEVGAILGRALMLVGDLREAEPLLRRGITAVRASDDRDPVALQWIASDLGWLCDYPAAREAAAEAADIARLQGALGVIPQAGEALAQALYVLGAWDAATATAAESLRLAHDTHQPRDGAWLCLVLGDIAAARGRRDDCVALIDEADAFAVGKPGWAGHGFAGPVLGHLALAMGDIDEAIDHLEREADLEREQASTFLYLPAFDLAEAYVRADRAAQARALIERIAPHVNQAWARAALDRCRGLVATEDRFDESFLASIDAFERLQVPFEAARSRLCFGEGLRRARRGAAARDELRAALTTFERLAAEPWAARAHRELEATGETLRRRGPSAIASLTPQELQVAQIVADGATNREAAARLFLSPKTIEAHLHRAYRKLGLTGRAQLRGALAQSGAPASTPTSPAPRSSGKS